VSELEAQEKIEEIVHKKDRCGYVLVDGDRTLSLDCHNLTPRALRDIADLLADVFKA
jgi:hypothetical protein